MSDTPTLPGDIPGLIRRGSPVIVLDPFVETDPITVVCGVDGRSQVYILAAVSYDGECAAWCSVGEVALDLSDATGRWHAVLWLDAQDYATHMSLVEGATLGMISDVRNAARFGRDMTPEQIDILRRVCLHVAGRS